VSSIKARAKHLEEFWKALVRLMLTKQDPFISEIVSYIKADENFFHEFMEAFNTREERRKALLSAIRRILIESSQKISGVS
jgi:hypothetical protein